MLCALPPFAPPFLFAGPEFFVTNLRAYANGGITVVWEDAPHFSVALRSTLAHILAQPETQHFLHFS